MAEYENLHRVWSAIWLKESWSQFCLAIQGLCEYYKSHIDELNWSDQSPRNQSSLEDIENEIIELSDSDESIINADSPGSERIGEFQAASTSLCDLAAQLQPRVDPADIVFELSDPDQKDELRALIKECALEWEKVDRYVN